MQDFTKEEFGLLGGSVVSSDKDLSSQSQHFNVHIHGNLHHQTLQHHHHHHHGVIGINIIPESTTIVDEIKLSQNSDLIEANESGKLEEADRDLYSWSTTNIGSQLLRSSDDPLISGGTNDNQNDNELSVATASQSMCSSPTPPPTQKHRNTIVVPTSILSPELPDTPVSPTPTPTKQSSGQSNRRGAAASGAASRQRRKGPIKLRFHHQALPPEYLDHYEATQNIAAKREQQQQLQNYGGTRASRMEKHAEQEREDRTNESVRNWLQKILELQKEGVSLAPVKDETESSSQRPAQGTQRNKVVSYSDLPYMGEMTLENSKPRRGRKPKKADICHLIYKNYGTILPGTPKPESLQERSTNGHRAQTRSSSLLERRLMSNEKNLQDGKGKREEPLNLCVRDGGGDPLDLSSSENESDGVYDSSCPTPIITPTDINTDQILATNMKMSLPNLQSTGPGTPTSGDTPSTADTPPGYMYWPNMSGFIHPMALYYQKLVDTNNTITPGQSSSSTSNSVPSTPTEILSSKLPITSNHSTPSPSSPVAPKQEPQHTLTPKPISQLIKPEKTSNSKTDSQSPISKSSPPTQKRKRSAIFIPPVPAENSTNPATEVSICKFKFTGGAKPCLQEKKMLSVDSGGNFRYYSGTGDKSMRGYEFFPRESLQQSSLHSTTTTGAFLNTPPVEKIACDLPPPSLGLSNDILQIPDFPSAANLTGLASPGNPLSQHRRQQPSEYSEGRRARRRSRRSSQRESLEKTFKEKGFLIQTQQMQSAEGATYCKFRQLRKFTRYLFRSWKDYLPGELQQQGTTSGEHPHDGLPMSASADHHHHLDEDSPVLEYPSSRTSHVRSERSVPTPSSISTPPPEVIPPQASPISNQLSIEHRS
ncbi:serine/arginine repetitive matrix protein 2 isoform X2 [Aedes aegypti]|nr:serine/arginine repetitive matrix protein 2 isoform X2 [Aedes aegypti]XP_021706278.1 serine/arginine repetitive matrix protein 2 isoform X2 [Aedes aegypti]